MPPWKQSITITLTLLRPESDNVTVTAGTVYTTFTELFYGGCMDSNFAW